MRVHDLVTLAPLTSIEAPKPSVAPRTRRCIGFFLWQHRRNRFKQSALLLGTKRLKSSELISTNAFTSRPKCRASMVISIASSG